ncbi:FAD-binding oxidoreductase [Haloarchaeobius sp. DFWS5]|uniref:FAD-binding oxidoreductase n=1 Tax=Haloarchaeobius sp. DFWS5 TaxID=3446114 RepID=UPI003EBEAD7A
MKGDGTQSEAATVESLSTGTLEEFDAALSGDLVLPTHDSYEEARRVWNGRVDYRPAMIAQCRDSNDVATAIRFARSHDLDVSVRSGGHHPSGSAVAPETVVVDCSEMTAVTVDTEARTVTAEPGITAAGLLEATQEHGLGVPTGSAGDVGLGGSTLGGGIGWIRRSKGLGIDFLREVEMVTADGEVRTVSQDEHSDLFWAMCGAGGQFGVATRFEFDCVEVGPIVPMVAVFYPGADAEAVYRAYDAAMADAPDEISTMAAYGHIPPMPMLPEQLHGEAAVQVMACYDGSVEEGMAALAPFRELGEPLAEIGEPMPYLALHQMGTEMFPGDRNYYWRSSFSEALDEALIAEVVELGRDGPSPSCGISVWALGGAMNTVARDATAFPWRDSGYMLTVEANWDDGLGDKDEHIEWALAIDDVFREHGATGAYIGFHGIEETDDRVEELCFGESCDRLREVKSEYDPAGLFGTALLAEDS